MGIMWMEYRGKAGGGNSKYTRVLGNSLSVQWLGLRTSIAEDTGLSPGWGTKIPQTEQHGQKLKLKCICVSNP